MDLARILVAIAFTGLITQLVGQVLISTFFAYKEEMINRMLQNGKGEV